MVGWSKTVSDVMPSTPSGVITNVYIVELTRWGISNTGTAPLQTTQGINNAFKWAFQQGYNYVRLPAGTYLVGKGGIENDLSETSCIYIQSNTTLDLRGCIIIKETNAWNFYSIIRLNNTSNSVLLGGKIQGDRATHNYSNNGWTYEGNRGIVGDGSIHNLLLDGVEVCDLPGYCVAFSGSNYEWAVIDGSIPQIEAGTFDSNGAPQANPNFVRTNRYYSLMDKDFMARLNTLGYFMITGNGYGSYGNRYDGGPVNLSTTMFSVFFYDSTGKFLGKLERRSYEPIPQSLFPVESTQFKVSFRYEFAKIITSTLRIGFNFLQLARNIRIANCKLHDSYALGIAFSASIGTIVENNEIYNMGGAQKAIGKRLYPFPMGIDIEDGGNATQHFTIRNNIFRENELHISIVQARNALIEGNQFIGGNGVVFQGPKGTNLVSRHNQYNGCTATGESNSFVIFEKDHFVGATFSLYHESIYEECVFDECQINVISFVYDTFVAGNSYTAGTAWLPKVFNGFYYVPSNNSFDQWVNIKYTIESYVISNKKVYKCSVAGAGISTIKPTHLSGPVSSADGYTWVYLNDALEPVWKTDGTDTIDNFGTTWKSLKFDPTYDQVSFRNCKFNYNQPEAYNGWLLRRCNLEFTNCNFKVNSGRYFVDGATGFDLSGKNSMIFKDCEINTLGELGNMIVDKLYFIRTRLIGLNNSYMNSSPLTAKRLLLEECSVDNCNLWFRGAINGTGRNATLRNNRITLTKTMKIASSTLVEGVYLSNYEAVFLEGNHIETPSVTVDMRGMAIAVEYFIKVTDIYFNSANVNSKIELRGSFRASGDVTPIPKTTAVIKDSYFTRATLTKTASFVSQVVTNIGEGITPIS